MKRIIGIIGALWLAFSVYAQHPSEWKLGVAVVLTEPDLPALFRYARQAGIECVEAALPDFRKTGATEYVRRIAAFKEYADKAGLRIWSIHIPFSWDYDLSWPDPVKQEQCRQYVLFVLDMAAGLGHYRKAVIHPSFEPIKPAERSERITALRRALTDLAPYVEKKYGVRLAVENLPRTCLGNSAAEMHAIIDSIPSADVCFDVNHLLTEKSEYFARAVGNRIGTVHMSDYDEINERHWLPGKGVVNWNEVLHALVEAGYTGPFMCEVTKTPWKGDMKKFCNDLAAVWKKIRSDYEVYSRKK